MSMTYEEREKIAMELMAEFLDDFTAPRGLDEDQQHKRMKYIANAFARRMPTSGDYREKIAALLLKLRDTHRSNTWPSQGDFVDLMPQRENMGVRPETYRPDPQERIKRLMESGQPVPECEVWRDQNVDDDILEGYRRACVRRWRAVYHSDAERLMARKCGDVVRPYFSEQ